MQSDIYERSHFRASTPDDEIFAYLHQSGVGDNDLPWLAPGKESLATSEAAILLGKGVRALVCGPYFKWQASGVVGKTWSEQLFPMHLDMACFEPEATSQDLVEDEDKLLLAAKLRASFEADPLEDGVSHPAEQIIAEALCATEGHRTLDWLKALSLDAKRPSFSSSVLRCLGRQKHPGTGLWRVGIVREGLATNDIEIRDAAAQAAELWGDLDLVEVLELHSEPESWLEDYIQGIIDDLRE